MTVFGKNIKKIRVLKNLSQQEFGDLFDISRGSIGSYEEGRAEPKLDTVLRISSYFNINLEHLLQKELTVNDVSNFANDFSNATESSELKGKQSAAHKAPYIEERIAQLEERMEKIEKLFKKLSEL